MTGDERQMLTVWLDSHRTTLLSKCELIDGEASARRGAAPSSLSLLGLVRHMSYVEWHWFDHVVAGKPSPPPISVTEEYARHDWHADLLREQIDGSVGE